MPEVVSKILIIGSKGFIGSHAYAYFSAQAEYDCWACDVVVDYVDERYFVIDSSNSDFNEIFEAESFDYCLNCSGAASVPDSLKHPLRDFSLNTYNVAKVLEAIRRHAPHCRFINLSSAAVYGNPISLPITEKAACMPVSPYGQHKLMAEMLCKQYAQYFDVATCCLRIFSAYGPGLQKQLLWDVFQKSKQSNSIALFGTGKESRDFIFVADIVRAIELVMKHAAFDGDAYNLASGTETTVGEIIALLLQELQYNGEVIYSGAGRSGDPINWQADVTSLTKLGFVPAVSVQEGVQHYVKWLYEEGLR
ncbi:NAD-dependent epimerase/dehydratase family protein [Hymenobacter sp. BT507]|uniref:NAD-dependent epimerase/dehydratase family protein n=1 Tax=Hymenobacter citatus TaxID=2763506 RepID=A0ABR7MKQ1_9BACT|nr:NAD-dependent epimerase/dehydratase family protein [Hymenobacter citatus]MBC6611647.1 NAD-dependent epimerase/dehydratase family protein [Hymenobacter citatus]